MFPRGRSSKSQELAFSFLQQQPSVPVFAAAVETAQHQEKIDDIGIGAGATCFPFDTVSC